MNAAWPRLSDASALLPRIRQALLGARAMEASGLAADLYPIVEDGLLGYELAPGDPAAPCIILGCMDDAIPRVRLTRWRAFDRRPGPRLATVGGRPVRNDRGPFFAESSQDESLYADWTTAATYARDTLQRTCGTHPPPARTEFAACRAIENALAIADLELAEWNPTVFLAGLPNVAELGIPLEAGDTGYGTLTLRHGGRWHLRWRNGLHTIARKWPWLSVPDALTAQANRSGSAC